MGIPLEVQNAFVRILGSDKFSKDFTDEAANGVLLPILHLSHNYGVIAQHINGCPR
jgi:hypothetical protein